ncbi:hypothetical protein TPHA_0F01170 [Tetrapisispora phaffii CBS 4417]|uniref:F-box domain-containing protein n=1 Tax=Tetrapisispora phaffii (strain ATCC 24235 / CBS 4417 / NBRC 1672 / NRRL Y-8282 / UCD 70-5) TaxID=1071381 RepID=G8BV20_TETPH|nr:hypothetical protein TPHA_0F01170 [Tetrapisispora phaffii CBS 4417]CCE63602.1 hypothetical protein TPHA_0F01170 [Tetrapisispora phaffii CBS 4417]
MQYLELPTEVLSIICENLDIKDILKLRLCNKKLSNLILYLEFWKEISRRNWTCHIDDDLILQSHINCHRDAIFEIGTQWFYFYKRYFVMEHDILNKVKTITTHLNSATSYVEKSKQIIMESDYDIYFALSNIINTSINSYKEKIYNQSFEITSICKRLNLTLLTNLFIEEFYPKILLSSDIFDLESNVLLPLSLIDPSYHYLHCYRAIFYRSFEKHIVSKFTTIDDFLDHSLVQRVLEISTYLNNNLKGVYQNNDNYTCINNYSLLRIYSKANAGRPILRLVILQYLLNKYHVISVISNNILTIRGNGKEHVCYIIIDKTLRFKLVNKQNMLSILLEAYGRTGYRESRELFFRKFFNPLRGKDLLNMLLEEVCENIAIENDPIPVEESTICPENMRSDVFKYLAIINHLWTPTNNELDSFDYVLYPQLFSYKGIVREEKVALSYWNLPIHNKLQLNMENIGYIQQFDTRMKVIIFENTVHRIHMDSNGTITRTSRTYTQGQNLLSGPKLEQFVFNISVLHFGKYFKSFNWNDKRFIMNENYRLLLEKHIKHITEISQKLH